MMQMMIRTLMQEYATFAKCQTHRNLSCYAMSVTGDIIHTTCNLPSLPFPTETGCVHHALTVSSN